jgi:type II secretory pathway pseudopilin PulG
MRAKTHRSDAGFSLAVLIFFATAALILLAAAVPSYQMQARREREAELIFRGEEYMRAIQKYRARFNAYPATLDALENQNGLRFLRRKYTDPTTDNKPFRLIYLNPDGSLTGSTIYSATNNTPRLGAAGTGSAAGGGGAAGGAQGTAGTAGTGGTTGIAGTVGNRGGGGATGGTGATGAAGGAGAAGAAGGNRGAGAPGTAQTFGTSGIVGVASDTDQTSIKVYNGRQKYNEWEFIAILGQPGAAQPGSAQPGSQPGSAVK